MTFESMSNLTAQQEYEDAIHKLAETVLLTDGQEPPKLWEDAVAALMKLYPQWEQHERRQCISEDIKEVKENTTIDDCCPACECTPCDCDWGME